MADVTITGLTTTLSTTTGAANILVGVDDNNGTPESKKAALTLFLDADNHVVDPTSITYSANTDVQQVLIDLDTAIVGERTLVENGGAALNAAGPTLNFSASFFLLTESPADDFEIIIKDSAIVTAKIADDNVTTAKIAANQVINSRLGDMAAYTLKGRNAGTTGDPQDFTINSVTEKGSPTTGDFFLITDGAATNAFKSADIGNLPFNNYTHPNHTGDVTSVADGATTIADEAVTNAKLAHAAAWTYKIRNAGTTGDPSDAALADFTTEASPASGDFLVGFLDTGEIRKFNANNFINAATKPQIVHLPAAAELPSSGGAAKSGHATTSYTRPILLYSASTDEEAAWTGILPDTYAGGDLNVTLVHGSSTGASTGNIVWSVSLESTTADTDSLNTDNFGTANTATVAAPASANTASYDSILLSSAAEKDSIAAGEMYRIKVLRDADNASDTMVGDAELYAVYLRES